MALPGPSSGVKRDEAARQQDKPAGRKGFFEDRESRRVCTVKDLIADRAGPGQRQACLCQDQRDLGLCAGQRQSQPLLPREQRAGRRPVEQSDKGVVGQGRRWCVI